MGSSLQTVPRWLKEHPGFQCDVVFVDGGKTPDIRFKDFANFAHMAHARTLVFFDEVTTLDCVNGTIPEEGCMLDANGKKIKDATTAKTARGTNRAASRGIISVDACKWPPGWAGLDGMCAAHYRFPLPAAATLQ